MHACYQGEVFYEKLAAAFQPSSIRILLIGDVVGREGRKALKKILPKLKECFLLDFISINGENLAGGFGITEKIYHEVCSYGVDTITMGNHWKDKADIHTLRAKYKNIILPHNLLHVSGVLEAKEFFLEKHGKMLQILNLMGNFAMRDQYGPLFQYLIAEKENLSNKVKAKTHILLADIHGEASSEKQAVVWFYDGILAALVGTHTHTPTADDRLTLKGTAFLTDVGMTGCYDSVIGMDKDKIIKRYLNPKEAPALEVASGDPWFCGFLVEVDLNTCLASSCYRLQCRDIVNNSWIVSKNDRFP